MVNIVNNKNPKTIESTEVIDREDERSREAYDLLRRSAEKCRPTNSIYVGSGAFHMYRDNGGGLTPPAYTFVSLTPIGSATEGMCIMGFQRLQAKIFQFFGRKEPTWRKG